MAQALPRFAGQRSLGVLLVIGLVLLSVCIGRRTHRSRAYRPLGGAVTVLDCSSACPGSPSEH
jgi:hypothetical protein